MAVGPAARHGFWAPRSLLSAITLGTVSVTQGAHVTELHLFGWQAGRKAQNPLVRRPQRRREELTTSILPQNPC